MQIIELQTDHLTAGLCARTRETGITAGLYADGNVHFANGRSCVMDFKDHFKQKVFFFIGGTENFRVGGRTENFRRRSALKRLSS